MREISNKIANIMQIIFGYGILMCLFVGGISFFGYVVALIVGGDTACLICTSIYNILYPYLVKLSTVLVLLGLVKMYLCGEVALKRN